jgi:DNA-binding XRE family transcriptional regulator
MNAIHMRRVRDETGLSQDKLAEHFGITSPTIRHALQIAERR